MRKSTQSLEGLEKEVQKLAPLAERMVKSFSGERMLGAAKALTAAITQLGGAGGIAAGVAKLTEAQQARVNRQLAEAIAKYKALGQAAPQAMLDLEKATRKVVPATVETSGGISGLIAKLGPLGPAIAAAFSTTAIIAFGKSLLATAGNFLDLANAAGVSTDAIQQFNFIGVTFGLTAEDMARSIETLNARVASGPNSTTDALTEMGLSVEALRAAGPEELFIQAAEAAGRIEDPLTKGRIASELFGDRLGKRLLPVLGDLRAEMKKASDAGAVMSEQTIKDADAFSDAWSQAWIIVTARITQGVRFFASANKVLAEAQAREAIDKLGLSANVTGRALESLTGQGIKLADSHGPSGPLITNAQILENWLKTLRSEGMEPLNRAERDAILTADAHGRSVQEMAQMLGKSEATIRLFIQANKDAATASREAARAAVDAAKAIADEFKRQMSINEATFESMDKIERAMLESRRGFAEKSATEQERIAQDTAQKQLEIFLGLNQQLTSLDAQRLRDLLAVQKLPTAEMAQAEAFKTVAAEIGQTMGAQIRENLLDAFESIPHFLTSSLLHSGNFLNGLKALGVSMADAIVEPLIKQFALKLAGARLASHIASAVGVGAGVAAIGGGAAAAGTVAAEVGGTAAATTAAVGGGGGGALAAIGGFATNPITFGVAGAIAGALLIKKLLGRDEETKVNPLRDQFFGQFQAKFGGNQAEGLARAFATAHVRADVADAWIKRVFAAEKLSPFRKAEAGVLALLNIGGLSGFKSFKMGGFTPPGAVDFALVHGGQMGEWHIPGELMQRMGQSMTVNVINNIRAIDTQGVREFVESPDFLSGLGNAVERNTGFIATKIQRSRTR